MNKKLNIKYFLFVVCIYILIFQDTLQEYIKPIQFFDEFLALFIFPLALYKLGKNKGIIKIEKKSIILLLCMLLIIITGFYSNITYKYQKLSIVLSDFIVVIKFTSMYFLSKILWNKEFIQKYKSKLLTHIKFVIVIFSILTFLNYLFHLFPASYRFGIMANQLFYGHPTRFAAACIFIYAFYILLSNKTKSIYALLLILMILSTMRFKAIGFAVISIFIIIIIEHSNRKISFTKMGLIALVGIVLAYDQITLYYFSNDEFARTALTKTSIQISTEYLPVGTGFGTFGSYFSSVNYSPVYSMYGINNIYGISRDNNSFVSDTFWPMILGQFGIIGLIAYLLLIITLFKKIQEEYNNKNKYYYCAKMLCLLYLIISSIAEAAFVNPISIPLALIIGINLDNKTEENNV